MKKNVYGFSAALAASMLLFASCSNIPEDERFLPYERPQVKSSIVIFEFTGQMCRNCPEGAATVHNIMERNPGAVFAINVHPENTTYTRPLGGLDLTSPASSFLYTYYHPQAFPAASINGAEPVNNTFLWGKLADAALNEASPATLALSTEYDADKRELTVHYDVDFNLYTTYETMVQIYLVEDGIIGMQLSQDGLLRDYVHNHVLRATLYDDWGYTLGSLFAVEEKVEGDVKIKLEEGWVPENCSVIGALRRGSDKMVVQAAEAKVTGDDAQTAE